MKPINHKTPMMKHPPSKPLMCPRHRVLARHNPARSQRLCRKLRAIAHSYMDQQRWAEAVTMCGTALETADILLHHDDIKAQAIERYIRCAIELTYTLRKSRHQPDLSALVELVQHRLAPRMSAATLAHTLTPLADIAFAPLTEVDTWMELLRAMDNAHHQTRH